MYGFMYYIISSLVHTLSQCCPMTISINDYIHTHYVVLCIHVLLVGCTINLKNKHLLSDQCSVLLQYNDDIYIYNINDMII